jgi:hypothetical protein
MHCANPITPSGGPKDETPPKLDSINSTPNEQVNFKKQNLFFGFDEWVVVKNPFEQVVISPPLNTFPEIKTKGRGVVVEFDENEKLLDSTTYTINFGEAIQDLNEGNVIENFKFVFSTGNVIDSLFIEGRVTDNREKKPMEGVLVMLYDKLEDSIIYKERPVYFSKTDKQGQFKIENIRQDSFILRALKDENLNYLYDIPTEWIAFWEFPLFINGKTQMPPFPLEVFQKETPVAISDIIDNSYRQIKIAFNQSIESGSLRPLDSIIGFQTVHVKDSIFGWYQSFPDTIVRFEILSGSFIDTISIGPYRTEEKTQKPVFNYLRSNTSSSTQRKPKSPVTFSFSNPIGSFDTTFISLVEDSINTSVGKFTIDSLNSRVLMLDRPWLESTSYQIEALPGAFTDIFGQQIPDTIQVKFKNAEIKRFGNIILSTDQLDTSKQYIVKLMNSQNLIETTMITGDTSWTKTYPLLPPKTYTVQFIEDVNRNGKWDTGDYNLLRMPEPIIVKELEPLRAGWDVTAEIKPNG